MTTFLVPSRFTRLALSLAMAVAGSASLSSCEKNAVQDITGSLPAVRIKFFNFGVNARQVNFYANDAKVSARFSSTGVEDTVGVAYGSVSAGGAYSAIDAGPYTLRGRVAGLVDKDLAITSLQSTLVAGKAYSMYVSGFYDATAKTVESFLIEDAFVDTLDFTVAYVRFVNAISNAPPMTMYALNTTTTTEGAVGGSVPYKAGGAFVAVPNGTYNLATRLDGSAANAIARTAVSFVAGRVYTITARGDFTVVSTTAVNRPTLDNTTNR